MNDILIASLGILAFLLALFIVIRKMRAVIDVPAATTEPTPEQVEAAFKIAEHRIELEEDLERLEEQRCAICRRVASGPMPQVVPGIFDRLPIFRSAKRLYGMPWRYVVGSSPDTWACAHHRAIARQRLEHFLANLRAGHADFNAAQENRVVVMNRVGLEQALREGDAQLANALAQMQKSPQPQLGA